MKKIVIASMPVRNTEAIVSIYTQNNKPEYISIQNTDDEALQGNIYVGRVDKVMDNLQAAFVRVGDGQMVYLPIKGIEHAIYKTPGRNGVCKAGDELLIQIDQEAQKMKLPHGTLNLTISGKYLVCSTGRKEINLSSKFTKEERKTVRKKLPEYLDKIGFGWIVRTGALHAMDEEITAEADLLRAEMERICKFGTARPCGALLYQEKTDWERMVLKYAVAGDAEIVTDIPEVYERLQNAPYCNIGSGIRLYNDPLLRLYKLYSMETLLDDLTSKQVWFGDGSFLVIEETEAFVVIDINSGKYTKNKSKEDAQTAINLKAIDEIARQLRLRQLSGTILVDIISMKDSRNKSLVMERFKDVLESSVSGAKVIDLTALQIVEITRKKEGPSLAEQIRKCVKKSS